MFFRAILDVFMAVKKIIFIKKKQGFIKIFSMLIIRAINTVK